MYIYIHAYKDPYKLIFKKHTTYFKLQLAIGLIRCSVE